MYRSSPHGRPRPGAVFRGAVGAAAAALLACSSSSSSSSSSGQQSAAASHAKSAMPEMSSSMPTASSSMSMGGGALPTGAKDMRVTITSPAPGTTVTGNSVTVHVQATGYRDTCALAGKQVMAMEATTTGHYHVLLDGSLVNMFCTPTAVVSLQNVKPGMHTLTVVPALDDHAQVTASARSVMFDYAPATPLPALAGMMTMGKPSITIVSPKPGATVSGNFTVKVRVKDFHLSSA